ncbi:MAG: tetratricopeptide repeat protein [Bryobacteraceae bacterium]|nr:tetratricopeptide repeat protein [Bryobacteraceae bacterium]
MYASVAAQALEAGDAAVAGVARYNLGRLMERSGRLREACGEFLAALRLLESVPGIDPPLAVRVMNGLAAVRLPMGELAKAKEVIRRALGSGLSAAPSDRASLLGMLGVILARRGRFAEAESMLREAAALGLGAGEAESLESGAVALANLASLQARAGRYAEAIQTGRSALALLEQLPDPFPAVLAATLANHAEALAHAGDAPGAEQCFRRAARVAEEKLGAAHAVLADVLGRWAAFLRRAGRKEEARPLAAAARRIEAQWRRDNLAGHTVDWQQMLAGRQR